MLCCALAGVLSLGTVASTPAPAQQNLPSMGEPADNALSPNEEKRLGAEFMRQIRNRLPLVSDTEIDEYVQSLGARLALASGKTDGDDFTFFVIDDPQVNAFAIPGGYVGVYVGLIEAMVREEQLAGVLAHEVAHVTQRHHARAFATSRQASFATAAAVLAALLVAAASPEAGQAALVGGLAATRQRAINFTRGNEIEADRIGIEILANARYDARAMAESFSILRRKNNLNSSGLEIEYLRTHPLDANRVAEATDRAAAMAPVEPAPPESFELFKARLEVLTTEDPGELRRSLAARHARRPDAYANYGLALLALRDGRLDEAALHIEALAALAPAEPGAALLRTDLLDARGDVDGADRSLAELAELYPDRYSIIERRLDRLIAAGRLDRALDVANDYLRGTEAPNPLAWREIADVRQRTGDLAGSHEALSRYFEEIGELARARAQIELALRYVPSASQDELRMQATLKAVRARISRFD